ncbi:hypothetical protein [Methylobacterium sp. J-067]|uniref:hypothetical protein n=1 Tax=Methylobacterium sp. J-067 TaxID=2836648 RepID=UPI001FBBA2EE|nr:hypothetical protein [Methylobacterium sp. J-067]MCJ2025144.1 hypothetical protein [Methylobacterium sp. J-067]
MKLLIIAAGFSICAFAAQSSNIPEALVQKSIVLKWSESQEIKRQDEQGWQEHQVERGTEIYFSSAGRIFKRERALSYRTRRGHNGRANTGESDAILNDANFLGTTLMVHMPLGQGAGMRQLSVSFSPSFDNCEAVVVTGKADGAESFAHKGMLAQRMVEFRKVKAGPVNCAVEGRNVFER